MSERRCQVPALHQPRPLRSGGGLQNKWEHNQCGVGDVLYNEIAGNRKSLFSSHLYELFFKSQEGQFNLETTPGFPALATRTGLSTFHPAPGCRAVPRSRAAATVGLLGKDGGGKRGESHVGLAHWQVGGNPDVPWERGWRLRFWKGLGQHITGR